MMINRSIVAFWLFCLSTVSAAGAIDSSRVDALYSNGRKHCAEGDYIDTLKELYAFRFIRQERLEKPEFRDIREGIDECIERAERMINMNMNIQRMNNLDLNGRGLHPGATGGRGKLKVSPSEK